MRVIYPSISNAVEYFNPFLVCAAIHVAVHLHHRLPSQMPIRIIKSIDRMFLQIRKLSVNSRKLVLRRR